ncbi:MAG: autotransporter assembly complex protein TamA [Methylophilaceae bacterium]
MNKQLLLLLVMLLVSLTARSENNLYQVEITAPKNVDALLEKHLRIVQWRDHPNMTRAEWQRLYNGAPENIKDLLATEGYFSPKISASSEQQNEITIAKFTVNPGNPAIISKVEINFTNEIAQQPESDTPSITTLRKDWLLQTGATFTQDAWARAKRNLLASLIVNRYPAATIDDSRAEVNPDTQSVALFVKINSGPAYRFGATSIEGLQRYPTSIVENLNPIKEGGFYNQSNLLTFQSRLLQSGYFRNVEVIANTRTDNPANTPVTVKVEENQSITVGTGAGYSTNTGARTQLTVDDRNLFNRGWRFSSSLKLEQKAQSLNGLIRLPVSAKGYRDSINAGIDKTSIEGQDLTDIKAGVNRSWGPRKREQTIGANYLISKQSLDGAASSNISVATLSYGITLRRVDNELSPTRGYLLNTQFSVAPLDALSEGEFLQSYIKGQGYYPITAKTQLILRGELGIVTGKNSAPAAFLFRTGGDQSVRGYAYQSLGVTEGDAIVGGRYLATGSVEVIQWLTNQWGVALFTDFGNAANTIEELSPVYGYGLGARWKSPIGPLGADIAYGEENDDYRLHFSLGVAF